MIHRFWTGPPAPPWVAAFGATTQAMHPDAELVDWTPDTLPPAIRQTLPGGRRAASNVARYHLLAMFGGIWLDCDVEPLRPLDDLLGDDLVVASCGGPEGGVMAAPAGHPTVAALTFAARSTVLTGARLIARVMRGGHPARAVPLYRHDAAGRLASADPWVDHAWATTRLRLAEDAGTTRVGHQRTYRPLMPADDVWARHVNSGPERPRWAVHVDRLPVAVR